MAADILFNQLVEMGYQPVMHPNEFVIFRFVIPHGRFRDREVEVALQAPNYPDIPPPGPHFKPHLLPITGGGGAHPLGAIHGSPMGTEWQYWSRPLTGWDQTAKNSEVYLAHLRTLLDFE